MSSISLIIPVFNEEDQLPKLLDHLLEISGKYLQEIIVVDGASTDGTAEIAQSYFEVNFVRSEKGRAVQMNAGAKAAKGEILYFLHSDSYPPARFDELIVREVINGNLAGCFQMKFDKDHWWLNLMGHFTKVNHISCRGGDQSLFVTKTLFEEIGGFDETYKVYEDNEIVKRLYQKTRFTIIRKWLTTSARLYERLGVWNTQLLFLEIYWKRRFGATAEQLYSHYYKRVNS